MNNVLVLSNERLRVRAEQILTRWHGGRRGSRKIGCGADRGRGKPRPYKENEGLKRGLRLLLLLLGFFGFFYGFAEVGDGGDFGGFQDVFAHRTPADVAVGDCGAGS